MIRLMAMIMFKNTVVCKLKIKLIVLSVNRMMLALRDVIRLELTRRWWKWALRLIMLWELRLALSMRL